ncbi:hypothetical protein C8T65DRAFT_648314 [Cerioporus squamosus]|nr:hypothetical protein C8T65DRAFT_648314 [Cerioporus squamosus]
MYPPRLVVVAVFASVACASHMDTNLRLVHSLSTHCCTIGWTFIVSNEVQSGQLRVIACRACIALLSPTTRSRQIWRTRANCIPRRPSAVDVLLVDCAVARNIRPGCAMDGTATFCEPFGRSTSGCSFDCTMSSDADAAATATVALFDSFYLGNYLLPSGRLSSLHLRHLHDI